MIKQATVQATYSYGAVKVKCPPKSKECRTDDPAVAISGALAALNGVKPGWESCHIEAKAGFEYSFSIKAGQSIADALAAFAPPKPAPKPEPVKLQEQAPEPAPKAKRA